MTRWVAITLGVLLFFAGHDSVSAHEVRPGYLELREGQPGSYDVLWKQPVRGRLAIKIEPVFPDACTYSRTFDFQDPQSDPGFVPDPASRVVKNWSIAPTIFSLTCARQPSEVSCLMSSRLNT